MRSKRYETARLRKLAKAVVGDSVLDIGYAQSPNPFLPDIHRVGYDLEKNSSIVDTYDEEILGDVHNIRDVLGRRKFDTIICGEIIEHLEDPYKFLRDVGTLLNDKGLLLLSTPNPIGFPVLFFELFRAKRYFYTHEHKHYFLPRWMERMICECGYDICRLTPVGLWLPFGVLPVCPVIASYQIIYVARKSPRPAGGE